MTEDAPNAQPSRANLVNWLRANLAMTVFIVGVVSGGIGTLISTTRAFDAAESRLSEVGVKATFNRIIIDKLQSELIEFERRLTATAKQSDMIDVDRRFNVAAADRADERRSRDGDVAGLAQRLAVLEAQLHMFADHLDRLPTPPPPLGAHK